MRTGRVATPHISIGIVSGTNIAASTNALPMNIRIIMNIAILLPIRINMHIGTFIPACAQKCGHQCAYR